MTDKCQWRRLNQLDLPQGTHTAGTAVWCSVLGLLYALFLLLCTLFFLADQDCSCCKDVLHTADLCILILCVTTSLVNIREAAIAVWSAKTVPLLCYYFALYHYYCNYIYNYLHYYKTQSRNWGWNSMQITGQLHHSSRGNVVRSIQQQGRLNLGPPRCLLPQQGRHRPRCPLGTHDGCMKAIQHAWQDETDRPSYQQTGQSLSSCPATHDPQVQDPDEPENNAYN